MLYFTCLFDQGLLSEYNYLEYNIFEMVLGPDEENTYSKTNKKTIIPFHSKNYPQLDYFLNKARIYLLFLFPPVMCIFLFYQF